MRLDAPTTEATRELPVTGPAGLGTEALVEAAAGRVLEAGLADDRLRRRQLREKLQRRVDLAHRAEVYGLWGCGGTTAAMVVYGALTGGMALWAEWFGRSRMPAVLMGALRHWLHDAFWLVIVAGFVVSMVCAFCAGWVRQFWVAYARRHEVVVRDPMSLDGITTRVE